MPNLPQQRALLSITPALEDTVLLIEEVVGREGLSELYHFQLKALADCHAVIPFDKVLGHAASVRLIQADGAVRHLHGVIRRVEQGRPDHEFLPLQLELVPRVWLLAQNRNCRIFQQQSVVDIAAELLQSIRSDLVFDLKGTYEPRDYCVQYQESDFTFLSRLFEEEGIYYWFEHEADKHVLVLSDYSSASKHLFQVPLGFIREGSKDIGLWSWHKAQELRPTTFVDWDQCFELPSADGFQNLEAREQLVNRVKVGEADHHLRLEIMDKVQVFEYPGDYAKRFDGVDPGGAPRPEDLTKIHEAGARTARLRAEEQASRALTVHGTSNCARLTPGYLCPVHDGPDRGNYLIAHVVHQARFTGYRSGTKESCEYRNSFGLLPIDLPYRPPMHTPRPRILGIQTATVVGDKAVTVDPYGRVKVQFPWDRQGRYDLNSSCWIRVAQVWAGRRWGAFFWPRPGHEVAVAFEDGDPDRPLIVGSVYNAANMPPYELPSHASAGGIKSCSLDGNPQQDFNGIVFHDELNNEHIQIHSQSHEVHTSQLSRFQRTNGQNVRFSGNSLWALLGSGSGGGALDFASNIPLPANMTVGEVAGGHWGQMLLGIANPVANLDFCLGSQLNVVSGGSRYSHILGGSDTRLTFDPLQLLKLIPGVSPTAISILTLGSVRGGCKELFLGSKNCQSYGGSTLDVHRCRHYAHKGNPFPARPTSPTDLAAQALTLFLGIAVYLVDEITEANYQLSNESKAPPEWYLTWPTFVTSKLQSLLIYLEKAVAEAEATEAKANESITKLALATAHLTAVLKIGAAIGMVEEDLNQLERRIFDAYTTASDTAETLLGVDADETGTPRELHQTCAGNYSIQARDITLLSTSPIEESGPTSININAQGDGMADGSVTVSGTQQVKLSVAQAFVNLDSVGTVSMHAAAQGSVIISVGAEPGTPSIAVAGALDQSITLQVLTSSVEVSPLGITLEYCPGGATISLTPAGIMFQFGASSINIDASGVAISGPCILNQSTLSYIVNTVTAQITAQGQLQQVSPAVTIQ